MLRMLRPRHRKGRGIAAEGSCSREPGAGIGGPARRSFPGRRSMWRPAAVFDAIAGQHASRPCWRSRRDAAPAAMR
ncbi:hypothetical protein F2981_02765 [Sinorhizobium meliloti]|nr:hypothetical protein [Sinorhizobium meliloti]